MAIEILGFAIKPEISIGDIAAIGALIASPIIFYVGYRRTKRNDQIRLFIERVSKLDEMYEEIRVYYHTKIDIHEYDTSSDEEQQQRSLTFMSRFNLIHHELQRLTILKNQRDLSPEITNQIASSMILILEEMKAFYDRFKKDLKDTRIPEAIGSDDFEVLMKGWKSG